MKRKFPITICIAAICLFLGGCAGSGNASTTPIPVQAPSDNAASSVEILDLTRMSATVRTAQMTNITNYPADYLGKTIKLSGTYTSQTIEETGETYHFVVRWDDTTCCLQYMEFILNGDRATIANYPEEAAEIEITGVFRNYNEDEQVYFYLDTPSYTLS